MKNKKLFKYNSDLFDNMKATYPLLQLGFFNDNTLLFVGQNPGTPFNKTSQAIENNIAAPQIFKEHEKIYETNILQCKIGTILTKIIKNKWHKISLTNIVKIPTDNNMEPSEQLIHIFFPITQKQIELLQPKLIICLGKFAGRQFGIDEFYKLQQYEQSLITMFHHPSYLMRAGLIGETTFMNDFINKTLKNAIKK